LNNYWAYGLKYTVISILEMS